MSSQEIMDYLTKQIFIEKNIVTFRSLSRHFSIHVNTAKNELATYHHNAPYQSQDCSATFLLSGTVLDFSSRTRGSRERERQFGVEDVEMDLGEGTPPAVEEDDDDDAGDGEEVPIMRVTIVNEKDLEEAKATYEEIHSIHVYSLSPAPIHDAGLLCIPTEYVRNMDNAKGPEYARTVGRIVDPTIKISKYKPRIRPGLNTETAIAGPSKIKPPAAETIPHVEVKEKEKPKFGPPGANNASKQPVKKNDFFKKVERPKEKEIKTEETEAETKKNFFAPKVTAASRSNSASNARPSLQPVTVVKEEKTSRGIKRKSSVEPVSNLVQEEKEKENTATSTFVPVADSGITRLTKRRVIYSDDDTEASSAQESQSKPKPKQKATSSLKADNVNNSAAERDVMALMDIDDDLVERVSRVPSSRTSLSVHEPEEEDEKSSVAQDDEDIDMDVDTPMTKPKPKTRKRKPKDEIPVGRNGLPKMKMKKTRTTMEDGYMCKEDYSEWESVESNAEPEPIVPPKTKRRAKAKEKEKVADVKKEEESPPSAPPPSEEGKEKVPAITMKSTAAVKTKPAGKTASSKAKKQTTINFFAPKK